MYDRDVLRVKRTIGAGIANYPYSFWPNGDILSGKKRVNLVGTFLPLFEKGCPLMVSLPTYEKFLWARFSHFLKIGSDKWAVCPLMPTFKTVSGQIFDFKRPSQRHYLACNVGEKPTYPLIFSIKV